MYKVYSDSWSLYDPNIEGLNLLEPELNLELNTAGEFKFGILPVHPYFDFLQKMKSIIKVYDDDVLIFRGRILNDEAGFYNDKIIICEGELAFLNDTIQRPYTFTGTPAELFTQFVNAHNAQSTPEHQFKLGNITVTDPNNYIARSDSGYKNTREAINEKLIGTHGGYLWVRHEADGNYIDYLSDFSTLNPQPIEFGKNLLNFKKEMRGEDIATAIIPLGAEDEATGNRITIESVNGGIDYVYSQEAVNLYGWIFKVVEWNDVTLPSNLLTKANAYLSDAVNLQGSIELDALDLPEQNSFKLGSYIKVKSQPHGIADENFLISKLTVNLSNPANNKLTLGRVFSTFADESIDANKKQIETIVTIENNTKDYTNQAVNQMSQSLINTIEQKATETLSTVGEQFYLKDETDKLISDVNTELTQTKNSFEFEFNQLTLDVNDVKNGADAKFIEINKYIRFDNGDIILGESGNQITLRIENDRISFLESNAEVAYFANRKLYVTDGEFINSLRVGNFAFVPRANGNLSFRKVT